VRYLQAIYDTDKYTDELEYLEGKLKYLKFMLQKKRKNEEIDAFLNKYSPSIRSKMNSILLRDLSQETLTKTVEQIKDTKKRIKDESRNQENLLASWKKLVAELPAKAKATNNRSVSLMEDDPDIEFFNLREAYKEDLTVPEETQDSSEDDEDDEDIDI